MTAKTAEEFNYSSLMAVIQATVFDEKGAYIPGNLMPSGKPVRAVGSTPADFRKKEIVTQWATVVKETYEREISQRDEEGIKADDAGPVVERADPAPKLDRGAPQKQASPLQALEEELKEREAQLSATIEELAANLAEAREEFLATRAALAAIKGVRDDKRIANRYDPTKKKRGRPPIHRPVG